MRMPRDQEDLVGKVCVCSVGRIAIVTGRRKFKFDRDEIECWVGLGLDGKGTWASKNPCIVAETGLEFHDRLLDRFDGKMAYNG